MSHHRHKFVKDTFGNEFSDLNDSLIRVVRSSLATEEAFRIVCEGDSQMPLLNAEMAERVARALLAFARRQGR